MAYIAPRSLEDSGCIDDVRSNIQLLNTAERFGTISYRIAIFCAVSYCIHHFPQWPYRAITRRVHVVE